MGNDMLRLIHTDNMVSVRIYIKSLVPILKITARGHDSSNRYNYKYYGIVYWNIE